MNRADIEARYRAMEDSELAALASQPDQLTTDAQTSLAQELARRRINPNKLSGEIRLHEIARRSRRGSKR